MENKPQQRPQIPSRDINGEIIPHEELFDAQLPELTEKSIRPLQDPKIPTKPYQPIIITKGQRENNPNFKD